jgi:hypothetical protein
VGLETCVDLETQAPPGHCLPEPRMDGIFHDHSAAFGIYDQNPACGTDLFDRHASGLLSVGVHPDEPVLQCS